MNSYERRIEDKPLSMHEDGISVPGVRGRWHVIEESDDFGAKMFLLEEEEHGDEWPYTVVDRYGNLVLANCWNGFNDLQEAIDGMLVLVRKDEVFNEVNIYRKVGMDD